MKSNFYKIIFFLVASVLAHESMGQGCVAVRSMGGNIMCNGGSSYNLPKGEFMIGANYRYFHSWRHFVGTAEQPLRQVTGGGHGQDGNDRGNAVNIYSNAIDIALSYGLSSRLQLNLAIPFVHNERSQVYAPNQKMNPVSTDTVRYSLYAQGLGDIRMSANYWIYDPAAAHNGNISIGLGVKLNTGSHSTSGVVPTEKGNVVQTNDQAIQPGDGGIGFSIEVQGFKKLFRGIYGFANGYYLFNPRESNGSFKNASTDVKDAYDKNKVIGSTPGYNLFASPDQYFARVGIQGSILKSKAVTLSLAARWEGIPAYDAFGGQTAYRRPGYVIAVESGISYRTGKHTISLFVPYNFVKNRIQSAQDKAVQRLQNSFIEDPAKKVHVQGDAAFADYSINLTYNYRLGKIF